MSDDIQDVVSKALRRAYSLGQTYWQQADSEYQSQWKKADDTQVKFDALVEDTHVAVELDRQQRGEPVGHVVLVNPGYATAYIHADLPHGTLLYAALQPAEPVKGEPSNMVLVPRDLIASALSAIDKKRNAPGTLAELRRYTTGDLARYQSAQPVNGDWPEDFVHENGNYMCKCHKCGNTFFGHKRRVTCKACAQPVVSAEPTKRDWKAIEAAIDEYLGDYELRGNEGDYKPTEQELLLISDAIHGLLDDDFLALLAAPVAAQPAASAGPVPVPWQDVVKAIHTVRAEASRRGEMFPQTADERAEDRKAVHRVAEMIEWYGERGSMKLPGWPTYAAPVAASAEPVAVVGEQFGLFWIGSGPIAPLIKRHSIKAGSKLYAAPVAAQPSVQGDGHE